MPSLPPLPGFSEVRLTRMFPCRRRQSRRKHVLVRDLAPSTRPADRPTRHVGVTGSPDTQVCVRTFYCWWPGSNGWPPPKAERLRVMFPLCEAATLCPYFHQLLKDHYFKILVKLTASVDKGHMDLFLSRSQKSTMTTDSQIALVCMCCVSALREF